MPQQSATGALAENNARVILEQVKRVAKIR
jgi:hypothetical protein